MPVLQSLIQKQKSITNIEYGGKGLLYGVEMDTQNNQVIFDFNSFTDNKYIHDITLPLDKLSSGEEILSKGTIIPVNLQIVYARDNMLTPFSLGNYSFTQISFDRDQISERSDTNLTKEYKLN